MVAFESGNSNETMTLSITASGQTTVSGQVYTTPLTGDGHPTQLAPINEPTSAKSGPITLSNGFVVTPALTAASPGTDSALQLPNSALISPGGLPAVVSGTTYSVLPSNRGLLVNGASTLSLPRLPSAPPIPPIVIIGGQTITANSEGFSLAGTNVLPGGPPVTISGTVVSLGQGALHVGSTDVPLPTSPSEVYTVDDHTFTAGPSGLNIGGTGVFVGGQTITVSGTPVFIDASSHLRTDRRR